MASLFQTILSIFVQDVPDQKLSYAPQPDADQRGLIYKLKRYAVSRVEQEMRVWKRAVQQAEDILRPRRVELYRLYHRSMEDDHLLSQVRTARFTVQMAPYSIRRNKKDDDAMTMLFKRPWFYTYLQHAVDSELYGHSLVEFHSNKDGAEFQQISLVPREHVRPEYGEVVLAIHDEKGLPYKDNPLNKYLVEIGDPYDLGLLKVASRSVIRKEYALTDWSRRNEKYGMPFLIVRTSTRKESELQAKEDMAANFGANAYAILDDQDQIDMLESNQAFTFQSFDRYADRMDAAISILINGQTGTTEEKAFVGSAEVHERILNSYTKARMTRIQYHINYALIPFLRRHGYAIPEDAQFNFHDLDDKPGAIPDTSDNNKAPKQELAAEKKRAVPSITLQYGDPCCEVHDHATRALSFSLDRIMEDAMRKVWDKKVKSGEVDADSWQYFAEQLDKAIQQGYGAQLAQISYEQATDWEMVAQLRRNIFVFAAFKNHAAIKDMTAALLDDDGNLREWPAFRDAVAPLTGQYFDLWLKAEYNTAVATGQTAAKWQEFQRNKEALPMLQYVTQQDDLVRAAHRAIDGVTLPIDDKFWDEYYPPNGWNCRCNIIQTAGPERKATVVLSEEQAPPLFRNNPAKSHELFPQSHPYFQTVPETQRPRLMRAVSELVYNQYDTATWNRLGYDSATGGYLVASNTAAADRLAMNVSIARNLMKAGDAVEILPGAVGTPDISRNGLLYMLADASNGDDVAALLKNATAPRLYVRLFSKADKKLRDQVQDALNTQTKAHTVELVDSAGKSITLKKKLP